MRLAGTIQHMGTYDELVEEGVDFVSISQSYQDEEHSEDGSEGDLKSEVGALE